MTTIKRTDPRHGVENIVKPPVMVPVIGRTRGGKFNGYHLEDQSYGDPETYSYEANYWRMDVNYSNRVIELALGEDGIAKLHGAIWPRRSYARFTWRTISEMLDPVKVAIRAGERDQRKLRDLALGVLQKVQAEFAYTKIESLLGDEGAPMQKIADVAEVYQ